ncbi:GNAT family N-acetyltransferase [Bacillus chungangensis]|uniref:N-acetylglutamate synthase-like GNAT family acetyltransferase n=1 Tax=Bacillus chungangensis TaxID=587633 RepID=A0ABT9WWD9_9BACI|nr:hypothetical protein [Bacillus chungangensis]MDQ0177545.1 N-acetylglutamate synthase-like GNAT family acetyltransferase [Bacillus chungangensis]
MEKTIRNATTADFERVKEFLEAKELSTIGLENALDHFLLIETEGRLVGTIGIEVQGSCGLLRSFVTRLPIQSADVIAMLGYIQELAFKKGIYTLYLATNHKDLLPVFQQFGFNEILKEQLSSTFADFPHGKHLLSVNDVHILQSTIK